MADRTPTDAKVGYLTKRPVHGHLLSQPRRRYFVATERWLEWYVGDAVTDSRKGRMLLEGAQVSRDGKRGALVVTSLNSDRLILTGDDLDGWETALRDRCNLLEASLPMASAPGSGGVPLHHLSQEMQALTSLDDDLVDALWREDIRLLRGSWLLQQPPGFRLPRRQDLEALEREAFEREEESPLLSGQEASELILSCNRGMGSFTHGWLTPGTRSPARRVQATFRSSRPIGCAPQATLIRRASASRL